MTSKLSVRLACSVAVTLITLMGSATPSIGAPNTVPPLWSPGYGI
jgi:hypothetical protein